MTDRIERAEALLQRFRPGTYRLLGAGFAGVAFRDATWVYKVHLPVISGGYGEQDHLPFLATKLDAFRGARHLYELRELTLHEGVYILVYPYEDSEPVVTASEDEWCSFLAELWERRLICRSVNLGSNFRRAGGVVKLIDYEIEPYDDNLFLNVAVRAFLQLPEVRARFANVAKLRRATINAFDLPEIDGFACFAARIGDTIAARARGRAEPPARPPRVPPDAIVGQPVEITSLLRGSRNAITVSAPLDAVDVRDVELAALGAGHRLRAYGLEAPAPVDGALDAPARLRLEFEPLADPVQPVTLVVKACLQDGDHLDAAVRHVVRGLSGPERFAERILALDLATRARFVRQFAAASSPEAVLAIAERLVADGVVDRIVQLPPEVEATRALNLRWFGLDSVHTHTEQGVPVAPQLHAFEATETDAILQVDVDALVGVHDAEVPVLAAMLRALADPNVVSVAFPIRQPAGSTFQPYFSRADGGFVPEVRCCLLLRSRMRALCPLPNESRAEGLTRTWYRAVEIRQRETGTLSLRGGPAARFFVHPQNYRKATPSTWLALIDRVEQGATPERQAGQPEVQGSLLDWSLPVRGEELVVVVTVTDEAPSTVARTLRDLAAQSHRGFGVLLVDASGRRRAGWIARAVGFDLERLTVVDHHAPTPKTAAVLEAVRRYVRRDDALVAFLDASDVLLGDRVVEQLHNRGELYGADVMIGKELSEARLREVGKHVHDLVVPRRSPETLSDGIFAVRRYLLDALDLRDVRVPMTKDVAANTFARISRSHAWLDDPHLVSLIVPAVELSRNPVCVDHFHVVRRRPAAERAVSPGLLAAVRSRPAKAEGAYDRGRKAFAPNMKRIEIDITYECNLKCEGCNRSCTQAPTRERMELAHVRRFVEESIALDKRWEVINVLGGEPTLHPEFREIIRMLLHDYVDAFSADTIVQVTSNGHGGHVRRRLEELPDHPRLVVNRESWKDSPHVPYFTPFNDAPCDDPAFADAEYGKGCWVTSYCGLGLNHLGYFPCAVAGGIERVLGAGRAVPSLTDVDASIAERLDTYCRLCGNFKHYAASRGEFVARSEKDAFANQPPSATWRRLYASRR